MTDTTPNARGLNRGHPAGLDDEALLKQCDTRRSRASGPGGQHRNKVETAIELTHRPTGVTASASERRSQADNHRMALKRLRLKLAIQVRTSRNLTDSANPMETPGAHPGAGASELWQSRIKARRIVLSADHADFPPILAEALDTLAAFAYDTTKAAAVLGVTGSQLVKLFQKEPAVLAMVNAERAQRGLRVLR
jgi:RF-1 domain